VAIISRTPDQLLYLNFYRRREDGAFRESDLWRLRVCGPLIAAIAERHFSLDVPASCSLDLLMDVFRRLGPAARLSEREVQTCARIAIGYSTERIARELKISKNSVVTFRRRAFAKLNIATHKELFALVLSRRHRMD